MKNKITKYISPVLISILLVTVSCEKWIDPTINDNPDALVSVPLNLILPTIEVAYGYEAGTFDMVGTPGIFMNYIAGVDRQAAAIDAYTLNPGDVNNIWNTYYAGPMQDCKKLIEQANIEPKSPYYSGIGKVMLAACMGNITSVFGDMPYSEAFQGTANLQPKFDTQQEIYTTIQTLLDEAVAELSADVADNYSPVQNDLIYDGDNDLWIRTARTLKARYAMHLSKKGDAAAATAALTALGTLATPLGLTSSGDDALVPFSDATPTENNPMFQFINQRSGYIESDPDLQALLAADPRLDVLANADVTMNAWCQPSTSVPLATYVEACFLFAEASFINGNTADAATAYNNGLRASLENLGVFDQVWYDANVETAGTITREAIITAKYIAICPSIEAYTDFRRTGFPVLTPNIGNNNGDVIPIRFPYPTDETNYNLNTPSGITINSTPWAFQ